MKADDFSFYYINSGSILIYPILGDREPDNTYLAKLKDGEWFGEWGFITGLGR
jgi:hypothetical protein